MQGLIGEDELEDIQNELGAVFSLPRQDFKLKLGDVLYIMVNSKFDQEGKVKVDLDRVEEVVNYIRGKKHFDANTLLQNTSEL